MPDAQSAQITLRPATRKDCRRLWQWRNEPATREASFNSCYIEYADHEQWFTRKMQSSDTQILIILDSDGREVGYVRFDIVTDHVELSVAIDTFQRGKGYGPAAIRQGADQFLSNGSGQLIIAHVKGDNQTSLVVFQRAGFVNMAIKEVAGIKVHEMVYKGSP